MKTIARLLVAVFSVVVLLATPASAEENRVTFPENFAEYVRYGIYDRGASGEEAFALPETIEISKNGLPLPNGTTLVLRILRNGELTSYFVMQKGDGWGLDFDEERRTGDWLEMDVGSKLLMQMSLVGWDFAAATPAFFLHHVAIVGLCATVAHFAMLFVRSRKPGTRAAMNQSETAGRPGR